jgi:uncharacterized protein (DUF362 family)
LKRRDFLKLAATTAAAGTAGCKSSELLETIVPEVSAIQAAKKRQGRSSVALIPCDSYDLDMVSILKDYAAKLKLPDVKGKRVVIKPNMVEFREDRPIHTNPRVLTWAIQLLKEMGAGEVVVAEGPGHMRDTEFLLESMGIGEVCQKENVRFVDLNLDDLVKIDNKDCFNGLKKMYLPKTIMEADCVISLPKLKMHHWVGVTCSMKNLFGCVPGRKYGWPKNLIHVKGIPATIIDLQHMIKPAFAIVDAVVSMEGDGPINGTAIKTGFLAMSSDLTALDATCARITSMPVEELSYMILAGKTVGNIDPAMIDLIGGKIEDYKKAFKQPITFANKELLSRAGQEGS